MKHQIYPRKQIFVAWTEPATLSETCYTGWLVSVVNLENEPPMALVRKASTLVVSHTGERRDIPVNRTTLVGVSYASLRQVNGAAMPELTEKEIWRN